MMPTPPLLLMRHGKSDWSQDIADIDRPLKPRGRAASTAVADWLGRTSLIPSSILTSPAARTLQTAQIVQNRLQLPTCTVQTDARIYGASDEMLRRVLAEFTTRNASTSRPGPLLLVGHNPGLEQLLQWLDPSQRPASDGKLIPTGTLAVLDGKAPLSELVRGWGHTRALVRPRSLRAPI
ncbi:MAG: histidine phosphatase family protein [Pseudomonadota bacterium]|nr:histidine phosphatase family protein [Pseudomonadota bacterium]